jgi:hypothetical protein
MKYCVWFLLLAVIVLFSSSTPPSDQRPIVIIHPTSRYDNTQRNVRPPSYTQRGMLSSSSSYTNVGYLESATQGMLPLYARPSPTHRWRYNYFTRNSNEYAVRLPVIREGRDCTNHLGCDELYDKDTVHVPGMQEPLKVHLYSKEFC